MRRTMMTWALSLAASVAGAQGAPTGWKEFDVLHTLLQSAVGVAKKGDLLAARDARNTLVIAAHALMASTGPMRCDNTQARVMMAAVQRDAVDVARLGDEQASDAKFLAALELTHRDFLVLAGPCLTTDSMSPAARSIQDSRMGNQLQHGQAQLAPPLKKP